MGKIEKDLFRTSCDITTFLYSAKKEKIITEEEFEKLGNYCAKYIRKKESNREVAKSIGEDVSCRHQSFEDRECLKHHTECFMCEDYEIVKKQGMELLCKKEFNEFDICNFTLNKKYKFKYDGGFGSELEYNTADDNG